MGVGVMVGVGVGVGVVVGVGVSVGVVVDVVVAVARNGGGVRSTGTLQDNVPTINARMDHRNTLNRRIFLLSPRERVCQFISGLL